MSHLTLDKTINKVNQWRMMVQPPCATLLPAQSLTRIEPSSNIYIPSSQGIHYALPKVFLTALGATQTLQQFIELYHPPRGHVESIASTADDADKLVILCDSDVVHALVTTLDEPATDNSSP